MWIGTESELWWIMVYLDSESNTNLFFLSVNADANSESVGSEDDKVGIWFSFLQDDFPPLYTRYLLFLSSHFYR